MMLYKFSKDELDNIFADNHKGAKVTGTYFRATQYIVVVKRAIIKEQKGSNLIMKKKLFLLLFPLTLAMISCGKDVDAKVDKVDLARLLNDEEITEAFEKVKDNYAKKLSKCEMNAAYLSDDLVNQKSELTGSQIITIKGEEYAESKAEGTTKVTHDFYSYTNKSVENRKVAAFGDYYLSYSESYNDGQTDNKEERLNYYEKSTRSVSEVISSLPFSESEINQATIGVDKRDNIYAVFYQETINTQEGHDQNGKDCTFKDKITYEVSAKFGTLKDPKIESYKVVRKKEANYDKELKIYNKYQVLESYVTSYKYEYKSRGNNDGRSQFISSLPERIITNASFTQDCYYQSSTNEYSFVGSDSLSVYSKKFDFSSGAFTAKASQVPFSKNYAYSFNATYNFIELDKSKEEITILPSQSNGVSLTSHADFVIVTASSSNPIQLYKLIDNISSSYYDVSFYLKDGQMSVSII